MSATEEPITARSLMKSEFRTIASDRPLGEGMDLVLASDENRSPLPVVVVHPDGSLAGVLTPLALFKALLRTVRTDEIDALGEPALFESMEGQLSIPVAEAMLREVPRAYPEDRLLSLMKINTEHRLEFTPVLENDRVTGIIYVTDIFHAAASLALTHDAEGIQLPPDEDNELSH